MSRINRISPLVIGAIAVGGILVATSLYGIGIASDSVWYIYGARSLANSTVVHSPLYLPLTQPPLYPILLALLSKLTHSDPFDLARIANALALGLTVAIGSKLLAHFTDKVPFLILGNLALLCSIPLYHVSTMALTEPLFNLLVLTTFAAFPAYARQRTYSFTILVLASCAAILTRYIGYTLLLTMLLTIWFLRPDTMRTKFQAAAVYGIASSAAVVAWVSRIWWHTGMPFGSRAPSSYLLIQNIGFTLDTIYHWILPDVVASHYGILSLTVLGVTASVVIYVAVVMKPQFDRADLNLEWALSPLLFIVLYVAGLIGTSTVIGYDRIDDRLLSPIYVPLVLVTVWLLDKTNKALRKKVTPIPVQWVMFALPAMLLLHPFWSVASYIKDDLQNGAGGFNTRAWRESSTLHYVQANPIPDGYAVYCNRTDFLFFFGNIESMTTLPIDEYNTYSSTEYVHSWIGKWPIDSPAYLIWFDDNANYLLSFGELSSIADMTVIERLDDGAVYLISRKEIGLESDND